MDLLGSVEWPELAGNFFWSILIAGTTSAITVKIALSRFYTEKWWEQKRDTYIEILTALHEMKVEVEALTNEEFHDRVLPTQYKKRIRETGAAARKRLEKYFDLAAFYLPSEAEKILKKCSKGLEDASETPNWPEHLDLRLHAVETTLVELRKMARKDLRGH